MLSWIKDFLFLFFPRLCQGCGRPLFRHEILLCLKCLCRLPETQFHMFEGNPVEMVFWGRVDIERAASFLFFNKKGLTQTLLHALKYKKCREIGFFLGEMYGERLKTTPAFSMADLIIPIPLHPKKLYRRGYNQSEIIGNGLSKALHIPLKTGILVRNIDNPTQTRKNRFQRWKNVESIFSVNHSEELSGKHIILVDDVLTTGATLEASIHALKDKADVRISIITLAYAWK